MRGYEAARVAIDSWEAQTARASLEILVLCPDHLAPSRDECGALPPGQVIVRVGDGYLHHARAIGVAHVTGDYVMLAEDHCLPEPEWAQVIIDRIADGWDGIGTVLRPGNRASHWAEASFLIGYGEWLMPLSAGPTTVLCGLNGTIRTDLLRARGDRLADELVIGAILVQRLGRSGERFYLETGAAMRHFDPSTASFAISSLAALGLGFGALRTQPWPWPLRMLYPLAMPLVAALHARRALRHYLRTRRRSALPVTALFLSFVLAVVWAVGEAVGALLGLPVVEPYVSRAEIRPVTREAVERADALETARTRPSGDDRERTRT
jgi:hypothetical protein